MFTGIVEDLGSVRALDRVADSARLAVTARLLNDVAMGDSVAVDGVCLTAVELLEDGFVADVMGETLDRTTLGRLAVGDPINLERAATMTTRLGGHVVQGHVDGVGVVLARRPAERWEEVDIGLPHELSRYVVAKGSVTIDGVSLTVAAVAEDTVSIGLIPETLRRTTLGRRAVGDHVEVDILAKYVERLLDARAGA